MGKSIFSQGKEKAFWKEKAETTRKDARGMINGEKKTTNYYYEHYYELPGWNRHF